MKRLLVIAALLGVMLALEGLKVDSAFATRPMTLAAIGFVVLAAFATAELGNALSLPRVTGYILAGAALGPSLGNILSGEVVTEMRMFNTLALGLIATSAGLELDLRQLLRLGKTLSATIAAKIALSVFLVGGTVVAVASVLNVGLPEALAKDSSATLALSLVLGVLAIGTSPAIALAVLNETQAKGRLADLVLGAAVFKDLVVVVSLAIAVAIARTLLVPGATLEPSVLGHVGVELGGSIVAGTVLGGILIAYIRFVKAEMLLFVAAMILVVAELCRAFHLELLLVFIAAGFVVRNFSKYEHDLMSPLELVALPVFVVFFTNAGAGIDLFATWQILPAAAAMCTARAVAYYIAGRVGARVGGEAPQVGNNAWYAYLPQAGVTLGLVGLAAQQLPTIGNAIATTGMAAVAINLLIGPVSLRKALQVAGEIPSSQPTPSTFSSGAASQRPRLGPASTRAADIDSIDVITQDEALGDLFVSFKAQTDKTVLEFHSTVGPELPSLPGVDEEPTLADFERLVSAHRRAYRGLFDELVASLAELPVAVQASLPIELLAAPAPAGRLTRLRLWRRRLTHKLFKSARQRQVAVRLGARITLERTFAELAQGLFEYSVSQRFSTAQHPESQPADVQATTQGRWRPLLESGFREFADLLLQMGTPHCPADRLRFSAVEPEIREAIQALDHSEEEAWARRAQAVWGSAVAERHIESLERSVSTALAREVTGPALTAAGKVPGALLVIRQELERIQEVRIEGSPINNVKQLSEWRQLIDRLTQDTLAEVSRELRASAAVRALGQEMKTATDKLPEQVRCLQLRAGAPASSLGIRRIELRALAERQLLRGLLPSVDATIRATSNLFARLPKRTADAMEPSWTKLRALAERLPGTEFDARVTEELSLAVHRLELIEARLKRQLHAHLDSIETGCKQAIRSLSDQLQHRGDESSTRQRLLSRWTELLRNRLTDATDWLKQHGPRSIALRDASDLRGAVERRRGEQLPDSVLRWFSQAPVRDERIFTAQRTLLESVVDEEAGWSSGAATAILLRGPIGSGKSSLLSMCALELRNNRVLRLDGGGTDQSGTLLQGLANSLGCNDDESAVVRELGLQRPAVLVDNLHTWVSRAEDRASELNLLLSLVTHTRTSAFWVVAVGEDALEVFEELSNVSEAFTRILRCRALNSGDVGELLEARRIRTGLDFGFRRTVVGRVLSRLGLGGERELFLRTLTHVSEGNPGLALSEWARAASFDDGRLLLDTRALRRGRTRIAQSLSTAQLGVLSIIARYGSADLEHLLDELGLPPDQLERHISFLHGAGLLEGSADGTLYQLPSDARWTIVLELRRLGALGQGLP